MNKAEELARKYCEGSSFEDACVESPAYIAGYHQAEKDLLKELIDDSDLPKLYSEMDLKEFSEEWDGSLYRSDAIIAGVKWMNNTICSEIEKRLEYMQYKPHRIDTYKELKSLLAYIKSYV